MRWLWIRRHSLRSLVGKFVAFWIGVAILYHEIWITDQSEPLLIFLGLWLCGLPPAMFFDSLRRLGAEAKSSLDPPDTSGVPKPPPLPPKDRDPWQL